jgi:glycosyltransferase involved in cell wall biosynthesis
MVRMPEILLSVVVPAYNRAHCLERALRSIAAQEIDSLEVLLGDDASTDETVAVARKVNPAIVVTTLEVNAGAAAARNAAAAGAQGEFVAFLDSDDEWLPGKIRAQIQFLQDHPGVGVCACGHIRQKQNGGALPVPGRNPDNWPLALSFAQSFHGASTPVIRRRVWEEVGPQDESLRVLEDWDWMLRASRVTGIHVLARPLARIYENRPSDPDYTLASTERFLAKQATHFATFGPRRHREIISQHWENAGVNWLRHGRRGGLAWLFRSWLAAPWRNPRVLGAFPLVLCDALTRRNDLLKILNRG